MGRKKIYLTSGEKQRAYRERAKRNAILQDKVLRFETARSQLVLELFPGAGLFGRAFRELGFCVVRGDDILYGGDVREMHLPPGRFDGIIGGAPCQFASRAAVMGTKAENLIPEFVRLVDEAKPTWAVMENVREAAAYAPAWNRVFLRDWDCGGLTHRSRGFWFYGLPAARKPPKRPGNPAYAVLASNWNHRGYSANGTMKNSHRHLTPWEAARLQGFPDLADKLIEKQPGWKKSSGVYAGVSLSSRHCLATHMLGNGVPHALGEYVANHILDQILMANFGVERTA